MSITSCSAECYMMNEYVHTVHGWVKEIGAHFIPDINICLISGLDGATYSMI